ncbi:MFS transporter [Acuticoccus sp. I52.16.1]|uniref:MFS transporter n=1 Tax=Acuticoccus sp. I52.16.1 TaxID=2928472 RepID=UPI001FD42CDE|nr:MFS transporter [Acuticoccus sp. I52.16.1]UOM35787.1 MFS transporter [Acuticoccus sp. I52.16.1]
MSNDLAATPTTRLAADRPETRAGLIILALALGGFAIGTSEFASMALVPYFSAAFGVTEADASDVISAYALGVVVGAPLLVVLGARWPKRRLLIAFMGGFAVFNAMSALAPSYEWLVAARFFSGLPHGAYFGVAALVAARQVAPNRRSSAVARVMLGLTVATIIGVPFANMLGQTVGWRSAYGVVSLLAAATAVSVALTVAPGRMSKESSPLQELGALVNRQVLLTLATGAVGFGGMFAVYTYLASTMITDMALPETLVPMALAVIGTGMTVGALAAGWAADRNQTLAAFVIMFGTLAAMALYPAASGSLPTYLMVIFVVGATGGLSTVLQTRLMDVAGDAQQLAAALNHSAFNMANALGPFAAATALTMGYGFADASGIVGVGLSVAGILVFTVTVLDARRLRGGTASAAPVPAE